MAYHSEFWVAVAAAAPVVGLAHAFAISRFMGMKGLRASIGVGFWLSLAATGLCGFDLAEALSSLANDRDTHSTTGAMWFVVLPLFLLIPLGIIELIANGDLEEA